MARLIKRVWNSLPVGMDGYRMVGIYDALFAVVPALTALPQPVFKPLGHPAMMDTMDNDHFHRGLLFLDCPDPDPQTLILLDASESITTLSHLNANNVPCVLFDFPRAVKAPEGFNGWFESTEVFTFENGQLVRRGAFRFLPQFEVIDVNPLDWQVET